MTNLVQFPGQSRPQPVAPHEELAALEIEYVRARLAQIRSETRQANIFWFWFCFRKLMFWAVVLWLLARILPMGF
jgi:hypothetical protein